jgi:DNA-binding winged helix-turn-helix (wHTH) protein/TolB-like protein
MDLILDTPEVRFCGYRLDTVARRLVTPEGTDATLAGRAYDVLVYLIAHRPRVVSKDELLAAVWAGRVVEENNLTQAISSLRRIFGTSGGERRFILTVPGRGYSFVAELEDITPQYGESVIAAETPAQEALPAWRRWILPALALALVVAVAVSWLLLPHASPIAARNVSTTLAVLPFRSLDEEKHDEMLELGIAETVITRLSRATRLRVLSLGAVQADAGPSVDPVGVGALLNADFVIDGHFQRSDGSVRVTARLLALPGGKTVWAGTFDESAQHVFELQDTIATSIASALAQRYAKLGPLAPCYGSDPDAYRAYLRGRYLLNRPAPRTIDTALASFREAVERDPSCARAWAGIAATRRTMVMVADHDPRVEFPLSDTAIARALAIDHDSAEAYVAKGFNEFWYHWDWAASERSLRHAIALDPNSVDAHFTLAHLLSNTGRHAEAMVEARRAQALDPLSPLVNTVAEDFTDDADRERKALAHFNEVLALEPDFWIALKHRSDILLEMGDNAGAERDALHAVQAANRNSRSLVYLARVYLRTGRADRIRQLLGELETRSRTAYVLPSTMAQLHIMLDEPEQALDLLEMGYDGKDIGLTFLRGWFAPLAGRPRYAALLEKMHLKPPVPDVHSTGNPVGSGH